MMPLTSSPRRAAAWERAREWFEGDEAVARGNTVMANALQFEIQRDRDAVGSPPMEAHGRDAEYAGAVPDWRCCARSCALQRDAVLRNNAMRRQCGASMDDGDGKASVDSDSDEERFRWYRKRHSELMHGSAPTLGSHSEVVRPAASESDDDA